VRELYDADITEANIVAASLSIEAVPARKPSPVGRA